MINNFQSYIVNQKIAELAKGFWTKFTYSSNFCRYHPYIIV